MGKKYEYDSVIQPQPHSQSKEDKDPVISPEEKQRENELEGMRHVNKKLIIFGMRILIATSIFFLVILIFVILPISQMGEEYDRPWDAIRSWATAFVNTGSTLGLTILAIVISDLVKNIYAIVKDSIKKEIEN